MQSGHNTWYWTELGDNAVQKQGIVIVAITAIAYGALLQDLLQRAGTDVRDALRSPKLHQARDETHKAVHYIKMHCVQIKGENNKGQTS